MNRIQEWLIKRLGGQPLPKKMEATGYFNGFCPACNTHIGAGILKTKGGKGLIECGHCGFIFPEPEETKNA